LSPANKCVVLDSDSLGFFKMSNQCDAHADKTGIAYGNEFRTGRINNSFTADEHVFSYFYASCPMQPYPQCCRSRCIKRHHLQNPVHNSLEWMLALLEFIVAQ